MERSMNLALEVVLAWQGTPERSELVRSARGARVVIGDAAGATFLLPAEVLAEAFTLAESSDVGEWMLHVPPGAVTRCAGLASEVASAAPGASLAMREGSKVDLELGAFTLHVRAMHAPETLPKAGLRLDRRVAGWMGASVAFHGALIGAMLLMPPTGHAISLTQISAEQRLARFATDAYEQEEQPPTILEQPDPQPGAAPGGAGQAAAGEEGRAGRENRHDRASGVAVRGNQSEARIAAEQAHNVGILGVLRGATASLSELVNPYSRETAAGDALADVIGLSADGEGIENGFGFGLHGAGRGGGCIGDDCGPIAGVGGNGLAGFGTGTCSREDFQEMEASHGHAYAVSHCSGAGNRGGVGGGSMPTRRSHVPTLTPQPPVTIGGLTREQVRRYVSRQLPQIRHCYEQDLIGHPDLAGRVAVQFMVQPTGAVSLSVLHPSSTLHHPSTEQCVVEAVQRITFPQSEGTTAVTYPFQFQPAGGGE